MVPGTVRKGNFNKVFGLTTGLIVFLMCNVSAQQLTPKEQVEQLMDQAVAQMNEGEYEQANLTFRQILGYDTVLPTDLSYLFAETLYMIHQFHNSKSFLDKYLRLVGTTGRYYPQALDLKRFLDDEFEQILTCNLCDNRGYRLVPCDVCHQTGVLTEDCYYCQSAGVARCDVCKGKGVITSLNAFSEAQYHTCSNCQGKGQVVCKVCQGNKIISEVCPACHGSHRKAGSQICDHQEETVGE